VRIGSRKWSRAGADRGERTFVRCRAYPSAQKILRKQKNQISASEWDAGGIQACSRWSSVSDTTGFVPPLTAPRQGCKQLALAKNRYPKEISCNLDRANNPAGIPPGCSNWGKFTGGVAAAPPTGYRLGCLRHPQTCLRHPQTTRYTDKSLWLQPTPWTYR
jgi:hypothetical protein